MNIIDDFQNCSPKEIGGKAWNLGRLRDLGFEVPAFVVLQDTESIKNQSLKLKNTTENAPSLRSNGDQLFRKISKNLNLHDGKKIILRSSLSLEDGSKHSFAGLLESKVINWGEKELESKIEYLQKALDSKRFQNYLRQNNLNEKDTKLNIIVQKYLEFDVGGVGFSSNPQTPEEGVLLNVAKGGVKQIVEGGKTEGIKVSHFDEIVQDSKLLSRSQILQIAETLRTLRQLWQAEIDIEFGIKNNTLWLLQVRPITSFNQTNSTLLDSSNIRENFPEQVLPLTYSLLQRIYSQTYFDLIKHSNFDESHLRNYQGWFDNLTANYHGHVYYNIGNWYNFSGLLPGSKRNNEGLQKMITGKVEDFVSQPKKYSWFGKLKYYSLVFWKYLNFRRTVGNYQKNTRQWLATFQFLDYSKFDLNTLYKHWVELTSRINREMYINAENDFLLMFFVELSRKRKGEEKTNQILQKISRQNPVISRQITDLQTIFNEISQHPELVELQDKPELLHVPPISTNQKSPPRPLFGSTPRTSSWRPRKEGEAPPPGSLEGEVRKGWVWRGGGDSVITHEIVNYAEMQKEPIISKILQDSKYKPIQRLAHAYLLTFKGRFPQELNLAKTDTSPKSVEDVLSLALDQGKQAVSAETFDSEKNQQLHKSSLASSHKQSHEETKEGRNSRLLSWPRQGGGTYRRSRWGLLFPLTRGLGGKGYEQDSRLRGNDNLLSNRSEYYPRVSFFLQNREHNRLIRAQFFDVVRQIFKAVGEKLYQKKYLENPEDIHYLTIDEVWNFVNLNGVNFNLKSLVEIRKRDYSTEFTSPNLWGQATLDGFYEGQVDQPEIKNKSKDSNILRGTPCSSGEAEGKLKILTKYPEADEELEIIAIRHLDPGWVGLFNRVKGVLIEQGGILSHGAIIARETGIPAIIGVDLSPLKNGQKIKMNANTGYVEVVR